MRPPASRGSSNCTRRQVLRATAAGAGGSLLVGTGLADRRVTQQQSGTVEEVWVETGTDTDDTGVPDRVHVELLRPFDSGPDRQVPVVLRPAPYRGPYDEFVSPEDIPELPAYARDTRGGVAANEVDLYNPASGGARARLSPGRVTPGPSDPFFEDIGRGSGLPSELIEEEVPYEAELLDEGYAFGYVAPPGTGLSTGCSTIGGPAEVESVVAAVDWLNGRRTGYDSREGGDPVDAPWTDGTTGLFGESYRGALANAAATVDPDGLETIVSMRSLSNWYTYLRSGGAAIWPSNDGPSEAITLASLGLTVTTREGAQRCTDTLGEIAERTDRETGNYNEFWAARNYLPDADNVSASVLLVHGLYDTNTRPREFAQFLGALDTDEVPYNVWLHQGGHDDPIDRHEDAWLDRLLAWYDHWLKDIDNGVMDEPPAVVEREDGTLSGYGDWPDPAMEPVSLAVRPGGQTAGGLALNPPAEPTTESLVDNSEVSPSEFLDVEGQHNDHRLVYRTDELESSLRVSGTVRPELTLSFDSETALVSGALVDYGETATIVNRGWTNPLNRDSLRESTPLEPGVAYDIEVPLQPVDYVFEPGHRLGFVLYASDYDVTKRPPSDPELTLHLGESRVEVPVVGGANGLTAALSESPDGEGGDGNGGDDTTDGDTGDDATAGGTDGDGAGLGVASAVAGLGGLSYLLGRRTGDSGK
jgi:X-Pro dipeptidyl-peptidase